MSDYNIRPGGSLKLKGAVVDGGVVKKYVSYPISPIFALTYVRKKKKSKTEPSKSDVDRARERERVRELLLQDEAGTGSGNGSDSNAASTSSRKTEAERRFEEVQRERVRPLLCLPGRIFLKHGQLAKRVAKLAGKTHKDRVSEFNAHLETLSEHHDIPKVCSLAILQSLLTMQPSRLVPDNTACVHGSWSLSMLDLFVYIYLVRWRKRGLLFSFCTVKCHNISREL